MRKSAILGGCLSVGFSMVALTACGGGVTPGMTAMTPATSLMLPAKKKSGELLYVADVGNNSIDVFDYPKGTSVQTLTGFTVPFGVCTDKKGDVFATDNYNGDIQEYAHGNSTPIAELSDINHSPAGCAVDPKKGDLAVANQASATGTHPGGVSIYTNGTTPSNVYNGPAGFQAWFCAYDTKGNLFIDGINGSSGAVELVELPKGGSTIKSIALPVKPYGPGGVAWSGKYLLLTDEQSTVYELSISGNKATKAGAIKLTGANSLYGFVIQGKDLVGAETNGKAVGIWKFPKGGAPIQTITGPISPIDVAISK